MNSLVFYSSKNSKGKVDATGAFIPEAKAFQKLHGIPSANMFPIECVGVPKWNRMATVFKILSERADKAPLDCLAFFGHGWPEGIQFGFDLSTVDRLADALSGVTFGDLRIVLYACLTAENSEEDSNTDNDLLGPGTDGGFADELRDALSQRGKDGWIDAHKTAGRATSNPFWVRFLMSSRPDNDMPGDFDFEGGTWIVQPKSSCWRAWVKALDAPDNTLRLRLPFMTELEIKAELAGLPWTGLRPV